jgi:hypothetical protein
MSAAEALALLEDGDLALAAARSGQVPARRAPACADRLGRPPWAA